MSEPVFDRARAERDALNEAGLLAWECDDWLVSLANTLLGTLACFATLRQDWRPALLATVGSDAAAAADREVEQARARFRLGQPIGTVQHAAHILGDEIIDHQAERRMLALRLLATTGRIVQVNTPGQCCIVVLSAEHLSARRLGLPERPAC